MENSGFSSAYFGLSKPNFHRQMKQKTFNPDDSAGKKMENETTTKRAPPPSSSGASNTQNTPAPHGGLGNLTPINTHNNESDKLRQQIPIEDEKTTPTGLGNLVSKPLTDVRVQPTKPPSSNNEREITLTEVSSGLVKTTPNEAPVPKPRARKLPEPSQASPVPKPRLHNVANKNTPTQQVGPDPAKQPVPKPRKSRPTSPVSPVNPVNQVKAAGNEVTRQTVYSKNTKEYKHQKKEENALKAMDIPEIVPPSRSPVLLCSAPRLRELDEQPRSIINILDLELSSIRSQYLKPEDISEDEEPDSDEETNLKIENLSKGSKDDLCHSGELLSELKDGKPNTGPPKPPRTRTKSPLLQHSNTDIVKISRVDPTIGLSKSGMSAKERKRSWMSPFLRRSSKKKDQQQSSYDDESYDVISTVSESTQFNPIDYPLHKAKNVADMQTILTKNPAIDVNKRNILYETPLHYILRKRRSKRAGLIMTLLQTGRVDVNAMDTGDDTPLHWAAKIDDYRCAAILLVFNADPFIKNNQSQQPIDMALTGSQLHTLLSKQFRFNDGEAFALSSMPEPCEAFDRDEITNERIGRLLKPDKISCLVRQIDQTMNDLEQDTFLNSYEAQPTSLRQLTQEEEDIRQSINDQKLYLKNWIKTAGSRMLFLDGGGVRGLVQLEILMEIERRTGRRITDLFDWIVGTSTGAIVALGLVYGKKSLEELRQLYFRLKNDVFGGSLAGTFIKMSQKTKNMEKVLKSVFGDKALMSSVQHPRVMVSATLNKRPLDTVFFNNFMKGEPELTEIPVWLAARASSAAPMYYSAACDGKYIDGGVLANNPSESAMAKIGEYDAVMGNPARYFSIAVSIGTGKIPQKPAGAEGKSYGGSGGVLNVKKHVQNLKELTDLFTVAFAESESTAKKFSVWCKQWKNPIPFFRFSPQLHSEMSPGETDDDKIIDMLLDTKQYIAHQDTQNSLDDLIKVFKRLQVEK